MLIMNCKKCLPSFLSILWKFWFMPIDWICPNCGLNMFGNKPEVEL